MKTQLANFFELAKNAERFGVHRADEISNGNFTVIFKNGLQSEVPPVLIGRIYGMPKIGEFQITFRSK